MAAAVADRVAHRAGRLVVTGLERAPGRAEHALARGLGLSGRRLEDRTVHRARPFRSSVRASRCSKRAERAGPAVAVVWGLTGHRARRDGMRFYIVRSPSARRSRPSARCTWHTACLSLVVGLRGGPPPPA